MVLKHNRVDS